MTDTSRLPICDRLQVMMSDPIGCGLARNWYANPDGPEAAEVIDELYDALELADATLRGANMNRDIVERKVAAALALARAEQAPA